jgi:non-specific serine/threonine protein kinase
MLLVADNCPHVAGAAADVLGGRVQAVRGRRVLATSRQALGVKGETIWRVPSLPVPKTAGNRPVRIADIQHVSAFLDFAAVRLFAERARAAESSFAISRKNSVAIVKICRVLDGIPLAIELAAARVKGMSVEKIAERLSDRFRLLLGHNTSASNAPIPRQQTLRASIDWSYDLLSDQEQTLLQRLSVFSGGWTLEAAEAVCTSSLIKEWELLELLTGLVEKSLVAYEPGEDRYRLLETIRQYLVDRVEEESKYELAEKHLQHFIWLAESAEPHLVGSRQAEWLDRLQSDHDNIRAALRWFRDRKRQGDAESGLRLVGAIWRYWLVRGFIAEGRAHVAHALDACIFKDPNEILAKALNAGGVLSLRQSDYRTARSYLEQSLAIRRELGDRALIASTLNNLGAIAIEQSDTDAARLFFEECLGISRELESRVVVANCLHNVGIVAYCEGDFDVARARFEEGLAVHRDLGDTAGIAGSLSVLGCVAYRKGDYVLACSLQRESLAIRRQLGDRQSIAQSLGHLSRGIQALGDNRAARELQVESLEIMRQLGFSSGIAACLEALASLAAVDRDEPDGSNLLSRSALLFGAAERLREVIGYPLAPIEQDDYRRHVDRARQAISSEDFNAAWRAGRTMPLDQAMELAMRREDD